MVATQVASMYGVLGLDDSGFQSGMKSADTLMGKVTGGLESLSDGLFKLGAKFSVISDPLRQFGMDGIQVASDFESAMVEISARTGIVGDDLEAVRKIALQMGADTVFSAQDAADAFLQLLSSGQSAEEAMATLPAVLDAAAASGEDLGKTADGITDIMAAFGLEAKDAGGVVNILAKAAGASSATMGDLSAGFANVGGVAKRFGLEVDETAAILAVFAENGIKGAEAGTALKSMLLNMNRPTEDVQGAWQRLGVSFYDATGNARDINDVLKDLKVALDPLPAEEQNEIMHTLAGSYGIVGLSALLGSISIDDMQGKMRDSAGAAEIADAKMDTFAGAMDSLKGSVETLQIQALTPLMENTLKPLVEKVTEIVNAVADWTTQNPEAARTIIMILGAVALLSPTLMALGAAVGVVSAALGVLLSPAVLVAGAIAAIMAAAELGYPGGIVQLFKDAANTAQMLAIMGLALLNAAAMAARTLIEGLTTAFANFVTGLQTTIATVGEFLNQNPQVVQWLVAIGLAIGTVTAAYGLMQAKIVLVSGVTWALAAAKTALAAATTAASGGFAAFTAAAWAALAPLAAVLGTIIAMKAAVDNFNAVTKEGRGLATNAVAEMSAAGTLTEDQLWQQVWASTKAEHGDNPLSNALARKLFEELKGSMVAPVAQDSGGRGNAGQPYMIGQGAQPEMFVPDSAGTFYPNAGGSMGNTYNINLSANSFSEGRAAADGFIGRLRELERSRG